MGIRSRPELVLATPAAVDAAVAAGRGAFRKWAGATPAERSTVLALLGALVADNAALFVAEEVCQTGKPVRLATDVAGPVITRGAESQQSTGVTRVESQRDGLRLQFRSTVEEGVLHCASHPGQHRPPLGETRYLHPERSRRLSFAPCGR